MPIDLSTCHPVDQYPRTAKNDEDQLFDAFDATALNTHLKGLMDGLSVKVFRTYNASITLDRLLWEPSGASETVEQRKADYDRANKEVCGLCGETAWGVGGVTGRATRGCCC